MKERSMDQTTLKIAIAAFMHDIGKFAGKEELEIDEHYFNNHADIYLPFYMGRFSHHHALNTAAFIEKMGGMLPKEFNSPDWGQGDAFINLAAGHHKPETPMQWIIAMADRISSGWDRDTFDKEYNRQIAWKDYKKTRLLPLFEQLLADTDRGYESMDDFSFRYPLKALSPESIFPGPKEAVTPGSVDEAASQYKVLFDEFVAALKGLRHNQQNIGLWFEHFESLMMTYTSSIPAARAGDVVPDVSLFDHSKMTSALAAAIYLFHWRTESLGAEAIKRYDDKKFLIINGDFYGIQDFIFAGYGDTRKQRSKLLRGRSFAVSLFSELGADMLCREIGLPSASIILNAAGKFTVMAPNTKESKMAVQKVETRINDWLIKVSCGETAMGFSFLEATPNDFVLGNFDSLRDRINQVMEKRKFSRIDLDSHGGVVGGYLDSFVNELEHPLCPVCGKRPSSKEVEGTSYVGAVQSACGLCRDHIFIGANLVKRNRVAILTRGADIKGTRLIEPIFNIYQLAFLEGALNDLAQKGQLLKYWSLETDIKEGVAQDISLKLINGYVPVYEKDDQQDERILSGLKSETKKLELIDQIKEKDPKTFGHIACKAMNPGEREGEFCGTEALGVLKADVDHLGMIMACGLKSERFTLSRLATLSRQINYFFALYLPHLLRGEPLFNNIYTVFAGGDDLFLLGPWNRIIDLAGVLNSKFAEYVCHNEEIHFSAGISVQKPQIPLGTLADRADTAIEESKSRGRDSLTLFGETVTWDQFKDLNSVQERLLEWFQKGWINQAMLYRLNSFIEMAAREKRVIQDDEIHLDDMLCTKWRSMLSYSTERNVAKEIKGEERKEAIDQVTGTTAQWLAEYGGRLKIPLWNILYNQR